MSNATEMDKRHSITPVKLLLRESHFLFEGEMPYEREKFLRKGGNLCYYYELRIPAAR